MPLFQPTIQREGLYGYDLDRLAASEAAQGRLQRAHARPVFVQGGGIHGAALQRRDEEEEQFLRAIEMAHRRQRMARAQRLTQEADLNAQRRMQAAGLIGGGLTSLGSSFAGLGLGASSNPLQQGGGHEGLRGDDQSLLRAEDAYFGGL